MERDPRELDDFLRLHKSSMDWVAWAESGHGFWREVSRSVEYWIERRSDVVAAAFNNALDNTRSDQMAWVKFFLELVDECSKARGKAEKTYDV